MTEKIYYSDAYIAEFEAKVISCEPMGECYDTVLDRTAFFPEEGGQYADSGYIDTAAVCDVKEIDGIIHHYTDKKLTPGSRVFCKINFDERYEKMQCHTGEHILSGIIHKLYGLSNVGFHLGAVDVTMDISKPLTQEELLRVERLANEVIYKNVPVTAHFPSLDELSAMEYRSKLQLTENVRIVTVGEYDACACCAPHVRSTGEIGLIKILDTSKLRGGMRLHISAGRRAMKLFQSFYTNAERISEALSVPKCEISDGVERLLCELSLVKGKLLAEKTARMEREAELVPNTDKNALYCFDDAEFSELIAFSNKAIGKVGGILVLLSGEDSSYRYVISSVSHDLKALAPEINKSLLGRGGGRPSMIQGSFNASLEDIKRYFNL